MSKIHCPPPYLREARPYEEANANLIKEAIYIFN